MSHTPINGTGPTSGKDLDIAIIGGGVCGVSCAIALQKHGIKARIYEGAVSSSCLLKEFRLSEPVFGS